MKVVNEFADVEITIDCSGMHLLTESDNFSLSHSEVNEMMTSIEVYKLINDKNKG